jgi:phosphoribosylformimino-5-aminoimidazole carboxamide ribotide isomerase
LTELNTNRREACPVIPVLDLMIGQIVLAQSGNRDAYLPVHSRLTHSSRPLDVAQAIFNQTSCDSLYLADIDSFAGANPNWNVYNELLERGFGLWVDAAWIQGNRVSEIAERITQPENLRVILSSETMSSVDEFAKLEKLASSGIELIFSLDKKGDSIITQPGELADCTALELVRLAYDRGIRNLIVLDLEAVGTNLGVAESKGLLPLIQEIKSELRDIALISGGGVREPADIQALLDAGCQHVLVASAIHDCKLTPDDISNFKAAGIAGK